MRQLLLLRHAQAVAKDAAGDFGRVLSEHGRAQAASVAAILAKLPAKPTAALVSPAARTRETWSLAAAGLGEVPTTFDERIYDSGPEALLASIRKAPPEAACVILVGHNPSIEEAAQALLRDRSVARTRLADFPTAGLATIGFEAAAWRDAAFGTGTLLDFEVPHGG